MYAAVRTSYRLAIAISGPGLYSRGPSATIQLPLFIASETLIRELAILTPVIRCERPTGISPRQGLRNLGQDQRVNTADILFIQPYPTPRKLQARESIQHLSRLPLLHLFLS